MKEFELTDMNDYRLIPQLIERMNEQMRIEGEKFICERLMDLQIDKDILFNQTQEIRRLNGILQEYKDKEKQGLLIEMPCKVGSKVYEIVDDCNFGADCHTRRMCSGCEYRDLHIEPLYLTTELSIVSSMTDFGKTIFLTRSEAEEALAKMGGANEDTD